MLGSSPLQFYDAAGNVLNDNLNNYLYDEMVASVR
jgi:hypothetical protein